MLHGHSPQTTNILQLFDLSIQQAPEQKAPHPSTAHARRLAIRNRGSRPRRKPGEHPTPWPNGHYEDDRGSGYPGESGVRRGEQRRQGESSLFPTESKSVSELALAVNPCSRPTTMWAGHGAVGSKGWRSVELRCVIKQTSRSLCRSLA